MQVPIPHRLWRLPYIFAADCAAAGGTVRCKYKLLRTAAGGEES